MVQDFQRAFCRSASAKAKEALWNTQGAGGRGGEWQQETYPDAAPAAPSFSFPLPPTYSEMAKAKAAPKAAAKAAPKKASGVAKQQEAENKKKKQAAQKKQAKAPEVGRPPRKHRMMHACGRDPAGCW